MKLKLGLVPGFFIKALAVPFMLGEAKYARGDWAKQKNPTEFRQARMDSLMRHLTEYLDGVTYDAEGPHHLAAVAWNALVILYYENQDPGIYGPGVCDEKSFLDTLAQYQAKQAPIPKRLDPITCKHPYNVHCLQCNPTRDPAVIQESLDEI